MVRSVFTRSTQCLALLLIVVSNAYGASAEHSMHSGSLASRTGGAADAADSRAVGSFGRSQRSLLQTPGAPTPSPATASTAGNTITIVIGANTNNGTSVSNQASGTPIQVLVCPGNPGCPTANTPAPSNTVTNGPVPPSGASSDISARGGKTAGPVTPENPRSDEVPPQGIDMSKLKAPDTVYATMMLRGVSTNDFVSKYSANMENITATITGTPTNSWNITIEQQQSQQQQQQYLKQGSRRLLQQPQLLNVTLSLFATNPLIVWYRLTRASAATSSSAGGQTFTGCGSDFCTKLIAAGIPVDTTSIKVSPDYPTILAAPTVSVTVNNVTKELDPAADTLNNVLLSTVAENQQRINTIRIIVGAVAGAVLGLILVAIIVWKRKAIMRMCCGASKAGAADAVPPMTAAAALPAGAAAAAAEKSRSTLAAAKGSRKATRKANDSRPQQQQDGQIKDPDLDSQTSDDETLSNPVTPPRRRFASFEKRKFKSAAAAAARSPITKASGSDASVSSVGSLGGDSRVAGSSNLMNQRSNPNRGVTSGRRGSEDGTNSEAGTVITITSAIGADSHEERQQRWQQQQREGVLPALEPGEREAVENYLARLQQAHQQPASP